MKTIGRTVAFVDREVLKGNLSRLTTQAMSHYNTWHGAVPMVKANAYGHGLVESAKVFAAHPQTLALGVATLAEGAELRRAGVRAPIWLFSESSPWTDEAARAVLKYRLSPMVHELSILQELLEPRYRNLRKHVSIHLKFNTGMNRLGLPPGEIAKIRALLRRGGLRVEGICSHLMSAESPRAAETRSQLRIFQSVVRALADLDVAHIHCGNTAGILEEGALELASVCNAVRPGIGLYGYAGGKGERLGLKPALTWRAQVLSARRLAKSEVVGYGATCRAQKLTWESVLGVGYGDGFRRALSNQSIEVAASRGACRSVRVLGRVSMDLAAIELQSKVGSWVTILGEGQAQGERLALAAGTIVYEMLTGISPRVPRVYR